MRNTKRITTIIIKATTKIELMPVNNPLKDLNKGSVI